MTARVIQGSFLGGRAGIPARATQTKLMPAWAAHTGWPVAAQRHSATEAPAVDPGQLSVAHSGGRPLPDPVRRKMEAALGSDFSGVRVHVGPQAERIGAVAFTLGADIYFAPGRYQPDTLQGQRLLGHELAHVMQQRAGRVRHPTGSGVAVVQDPLLEAEADRLGARAAGYRIAPPRSALQASPDRVAFAAVSAPARVPRPRAVPVRPPQTSRFMMQPKATARFGALGPGSRAPAMTDLTPRTIQRHGPGDNHKNFVLSDYQHLDKHLGEWSKLGVNSVDEVEGVARELFSKTMQNQWQREKNRSDYYVDHEWKGKTVRLVWSQLGGIVTCFPKDQQPKSSGKSKKSSKMRSKPWQGLNKGQNQSGFPWSGETSYQSQHSQVQYGQQYMPDYSQYGYGYGYNNNNNQQNITPGSQPQGQYRTGEDGTQWWYSEQEGRWYWWDGSQWVLYS